MAPLIITQNEIICTSYLCKIAKEYGHQEKCIKTKELLVR